MWSGGITAAEHDLAERQIHAKYDAEVANIEHQGEAARAQAANLQAQLTGQLPLEERSRQKELDVDRGQLTNMQNQFTDLKRQFDLAVKKFDDSRSTEALMKWVFEMESWRFQFGGINDHLSERYRDFVDILMRVYAAMSRLQAAIADSKIYAQGAGGPTATSIAGDAPPSPQGWLTSQEQVTAAGNALNDVQRALDAAEAAYGNAEAQISTKADRIADEMDAARRRLADQIVATEEEMRRDDDRINQLRAAESTDIDTLPPVT